MTGYEVFCQALQLLNYTNSYGELDGNENGELYKRSLAIVNQIYTDVAHIENPTAAAAPLTNVRQALLISDRAAREAMPYGVAMLLAQNESDGDNQTLFASLYNQKRASVPRAACLRRDVLPCTQG